MRIAFVITNAPPLIGGIEKVCLRVAQGFKNDGHEVSIICRFTKSRHTLKEYFSNSEESSLFENNSIKTAILGLNYIQIILLKPVFNLIWRKATFDIARRIYSLVFRSALHRNIENADVVHFFGTGLEMLGFAAAATAKKTGAMFVVEPALHSGQWGDSWIDKKLYERADIVIAHTQYEKNVLEKMGIDKNKIKVIVHGVDQVSAGDAGRFKKRYGITGDIVLFLGRKTKEKGILRVIEAWPDVLLRRPDATLVLVGPRHKKIDIKPLPSILDLENLNDLEKEDALAACDVLCVPSEGESFGMVYFEAWGYQKPVIALNLPVFVETISKSCGGILVSDQKSLIDALCEILSDQVLKKKMGCCGYNIYLQHQWDKSLTSYKDAYSSSGLKF